MNERLQRDLAEARTNDVLKALDGDVELRAHAARIQEILGWSARRVIPILCIRSEAPLDRNAFSGFFDREQRRAYVALGRTCALATPLEE